MLNIAMNQVARRVALCMPSSSVFVGVRTSAANFARVKTMNRFNAGGLLPP